MKKIILFGICTLLCSCASRNLHHFSYGVSIESPKKDLTGKFGLQQALVFLGRETVASHVSRNDSSCCVSLTPYARVQSTDEGFYFYRCYGYSFLSARFLDYPPTLPLIYLDAKYRVKYILWRKPKRNRRILRSISPELMEQLRLENKLDSSVLNLR